MKKDCMDRRRFARCLACAALGGPTLLQILEKGAHAQEKLVVDLSDPHFAPLRTVGGAVKVDIEGMADPVIVTRVDRDTYAAFSSACTHWGCEVELPDELGEIRCLCHNSVFDIQGRYLEGQADGDLLRIDFELRVPTAVQERTWGRIKKDL